MARLARRFGTSMTEVRAMTVQDINAMASVLQEEELARKRAQARSGLKGRR